MAICGTLYLSNDPSQLGPDATLEDLGVWGDNVAAAAFEKFGVKLHIVYGSHSRTDCDHVEVRAWIHELESGDGWLDYLDSN